MQFCFDLRGFARTATFVGSNLLVRGRLYFELS